jgi:ankyrin repeat protein
MENVGLLPPGLNPIYAQIMDEINSFSRHTLELIRRTLNLLLYQQAKLNQVEFIRFISPGIADVDIKAKAIDIVDACRHLIEVDLVRNSLRLAHASVQEYLVEVYSEKDSQKEYLPNQGNAAISKMCIQILQNVVDSTYCRHGAAYAESFWIYHLAECTDLRAQDTALKTILDECHVTADTPSWLKQWLRATRLPTLTSIDSSSHKHIYEVKYAASHSLIATSLFLVCAFGFGELLCDADVLPLNLLQLNNIWEESPLTVSIEYGHLSIARQLIGKIERTQTLDQNFSQWRQSELTQALCCAAKYGHQDVLDLIIKAGADVNTKNTDGVTPLQSAVLNGQVQVLKKLMLDHGVSTTATDARGNSILMQAISRNHPECVELLLAEVTDIEIPNKVGDGPLHKAAAVGNCWVIEMLLQKNGNLEARNRMSERPLHVASARNSLKVVQLLVDRGARTDSRDVEGKSPLHVAAENGRAEIVRYLVNSNCDIDLRDERGMSPLHYAVLASHTVVGILIAAGADVDAETKDGETPYLLAVRMNRVADIWLTRSEHTI